MRRAILDQFLAAKKAGQPVALVTDITTGLQTLVFPTVQSGQVALDDERLARVRRMLDDDKSGMLDEALFVQAAAPPLRLIIVGAVHIAQALAPLAAFTGYRVIVVDPRRAFASDERFPQVAMRDDWPDEALTELKPDSRTAVVTLTHDPKLDDPALEAALASPAFYIGALGSRKTHAGRLGRLRERGFAEADLARIHGPIGLAIGAVSQAEIAIAILGEITAARRLGDTALRKAS